MKVSVFFASSGRAEMFNKALLSLYDTTQRYVYDLDVVAAIDADPKAWDFASEFGVRCWYSSVRRGALQAWNDALSMTNGNILVPAGDDQLFHDGWLEYALESHKNILDGYGVVGMNDLAYDGNKQLATMFLFDRKYCKEVMGGVFAPPVYKYYNVDSEWNEKAKSLGRFYWDERSIVEHLHSAHGKRPIDEHDLNRQESKWMEIDNRIFEERKANNFPIMWHSII